MFFLPLVSHTVFHVDNKILDPHTIDVDGKVYSARNILIAVGGRPSILDIPGSEYAIDSDAALDLPTKPKKIAIVGGGYIAVEFAGIFNGLGSEVHVFIRQQKVLRGFDEEVESMIFYYSFCVGNLSPISNSLLRFCRLEILSESKCLFEESSSTRRRLPKLSLKPVMVPYL